MHNYDDGDEIYLFGFSRGAYTVRSLAGMMRNVGLLRKSEADKLQDAFRLYHRPDAAPNSYEARLFRASYSHEVEVTFIGVWDTVGALGIPVRGIAQVPVLGRLAAARRHQFHDVELNRWVKRACHALSIDETRCPFRASLWEYQPKPGQTVEQVWFPGTHGGHRRNRRVRPPVPRPVPVDGGAGIGLSAWPLTLTTICRQSAPNRRPACWKESGSGYPPAPGKSAKTIPSGCIPRPATASSKRHSTARET